MKIEETYIKKIRAYSNQGQFTVTESIEFLKLIELSKINENLTLILKK